MKIHDAVDFFSELYGGEHRLRFKIEPFGKGFCINHSGDIATTDSDLLTKAVFLAHDHCVRFSIQPSQENQFYIKLIIHTRERSGSFIERHPTLEHAIQNHIDNVRKKIVS